MSSAGETQHQMWAEQLKSLLDDEHESRELKTEQTRRLMVAASVVLRLHQVDVRGQCRYCRRSTWWPWRRRPCTVHATFKVAMIQPITMVRA